MSIGAKPWEGSGSASVPDASETTKGKIRIATSSEAATGTDDLTVMTPLTVKERIDASLVGGVEYKGTFNATTGAPPLTNAEQGDLYVIGVAGTIYGQDWALGDQLLINADMGGIITNSKINKVDNTQAVTSVNTQTGAVTLTASDVGALASGDNVSELTNDSGYITSAPVTSVNTQTGVVTLSGDDLAADHTAVNYTAANANIDGHLSGIDSALGSSANPTLDGVTDNGNTTTNALNVGTVTTSGDLLADADATRTIGAEDTRFITTFSDLNGAVRFKAKNDQGSAITKGQVVYIKGVSGTVPTVGLARANSASTMPAFGLALANANDQAEVQIVTFGNLTDYDTTTYSLSANDTVFVSAATAGALTNSAPSGEANLIQNIGRVVRADASAGIIKVGGAGRSAATPNLDQDKIFVGDASNQAVSTALSAIDLSAFNNDLSFQPLDTGLTSISGLTTSADKMIYTTASDSYAVASISSFGRTLVSTGDAGATRSALNLGTSSTLDVGTTANKVVQLNSSAQLPAVDGSLLTNLPSGATQLNDLSDVTITGAATGEVLRYSGSSWVDATLAYADISGTPTLATVATTGAYADVTGTPTLATVATSGAYADVTGTPTLAAVATSGAYADVTGTPTLATVATTGAYADVTGTPDLSTYAPLASPALTGSPTAPTQTQSDGSTKLATTAYVDTAVAAGGGGVTYSPITADPSPAVIAYHYSCTGTFTITIPTSQTAGSEIRIKNMGTGTVTLDPQGSNIDGSSTNYTIDVQFGALTLVSDGTGWEII